MHLTRLGVPILGDDLYPEVRDVAADDFRRPLQLLAAGLAFPDPVTGQDRAFATRLRLRAWDDPEGWAGPATEPARPPVSS